MTFKVGLTQLELIDSSRRNWAGDGPRPMRTHLWYPATPEAEEQEIEIGRPGAPLMLAGRAAPGARWADGPERFPLVLLSHGTGGAALQLGWLATALARQGWAGAAVNHHGNNALEPYLVQGFARVWERALDLTAVLNQLLTHPTCGPRLDGDRVGAAGFSLGGYTVLALAGARLNLRLMAPALADPARDMLREMPPEFPNPQALLDTLRDLAAHDNRHRASFHDERVRAAFAIAPVLGEAFDATGVQDVRVPVEIVVGGADTAAPPGPNAAHLAALIPSARLTILPDVAHYTFLAEATAAGRQQLPDLSMDPAGVDRAAVHAQVADMAREFFEETLLRD